MFEDQTARFRVSAVLAGVFSALALILPAASLYGVVSLLVARGTIHGSLPPAVPLRAVFGSNSSD